MRRSLPSAVTVQILSRCRRSSFSEKSSSQNSSDARLPASLVGGFRAPQLDAADLAGNRLRQFGEFEPSHPLERRQRGAAMPEDRQRRRAIRRVAGRERQKRLRHGKPHRIGRRHDGGFGDGGMLDQHAFKLEWADPVVGRFEDVVGAADIGQIAVVIDRGDIAGAIDRACRSARRRRRRPDSPASARSAAAAR